MSRYLSKTAVAELLDLSERSVQKLIAEAKLPPPVKIGGSNRWNADELEQYLKDLARKQAETTERENPRHEALQ